MCWLPSRPAASINTRIVNNKYERVLLSPAARVMKRCAGHSAGTKPRSRAINRIGVESTVGIIGWLVVGLIAGFLAKYVVPGEGPGGVVGDIVIGVIGAFLGGWIFNYFGHSATTGINLYSIFVAFVGAVILLFIGRALSRARA